MAESRALSSIPFYLISFSLSLRFVEEDPGRQSLSGSFNPIDDTEWGVQVYIGPTEKFFKAIVASDRTTVARLIAEGADVNRRDHVGRMPLHVAVLAKAEDIACDLIDAGARITSRLAEGKTALHCAAQLDQPKVVTKLLEQSQKNAMLSKKGEDVDVDVEMKDAARNSSEDDWSSGDDGVVSMEEDENEDDEDNEEGSRKKKLKTSEPPQTPADSSALPEDESGEPDVFDINSPDWDLCFTPLYYAILYASTPVIDALLLAGADPHLVSKASYYQAPQLNPLLLTMSDSNEEHASLVIESLLKAGVVSSAADPEITTILHRMVAANKTKLVNTLLRLDPKAAAAINLPSMKRAPIFPLVTAVQMNNYAMVAILLAYGADVIFKAEDVERAKELQRE